MEKQAVDKISKEVIILSATKIASEIEEVSSVKEVKVSKHKDDLSLDILVNVFLGVKIPQIAWDIQNAVQSALFQLIQIEIKKIDIHIEGVDLLKEGQ